LLVGGFILFGHYKNGSMGRVVCELLSTQFLGPTCSDGPFNNGEVIYRRSTDTELVLVIL